MNNSGRLLSAVIILTLVGVACRSSEEDHMNPSEPISVVTQTADLVQGTAIHRFSGTVTSDRTVNISSKVMGRITQLDVEEGDFVEKGDLLVRIKDDNLQAQKNQAQSSLIEARASLKNTETNYNRIKNLFEQESVTKKEFDDISTQYEMAKARVKKLVSKLQEIEDILDYTLLTAPFDGYVVSKMASEGDMAAPAKPIMAFEQKNMMKIKVTVPESEISLFNLNDTVSVNVKAAGYQTDEGVIANINQAGKRGSRQFTVEITLPELPENSGLKSGMFAEAGLASDKDRTIMVPKSAIIEHGQLTGLYTLNNNSEVVLRWVRLGDTTGDHVEVLSGLADGETFVASVDQRLREGQKVNTQ